MCEDCFQEQIYKFESETQFHQFEDILQGRCTQKKMGIIDKKHENYWSFLEFRLYYKGFRVTKSDLKIRPIYYGLQRRIEAYICISFVAYKVYKELERQLYLKKAGISPQ